MMSNLIFGDADELYINGGQSNIYWHESTHKELTQWQVNITAANLGNDKLPTSKHNQTTFISTRSPYIGLTNEVFESFVQKIQRLDDSIFCDETFCYGKNEDCTYYHDKIPELKFSLSSGSHIEYTIASSDLMVQQGSTYNC